ncbi:MAG TPA: glycosyltransferase [Bacteroidia bacterium]|nr:glycosyltransferase [Bacteroidia bacterium]
MKLSVVIVNYNVQYFLEQCLRSVEIACKRVSSEVFVVDNNSVDGSVEMVQEKFPSVRLIANKENLGFSKANNQAIRIASGEYVLLLNPDTVVEEDTFEKIVRFMDEHPDAGGLGVKMIDGSGRYLPESKRGLPTPAVAFYKIFGLSALFPRSTRFGRYHLGFLDKNETHVVDVLAGAFMLLRQAALTKCGLLDEDFFMYGEDIDLSYRIQKAGFKNYYFPGTQIIHYKGESTKKSSVNYVFVFYNAMIIFAKKHFSPQNASLFSFFIRIAIYLRAGAAVLTRAFRNLLLPALDFGFLFAGLYFLQAYWGTNMNVRYPELFLQAAVPTYILCWIVCIYFSGGYDVPIRIAKVVRGVFTGTLIILVGYALLPEHYRFSRALILLGAAWATAAAVVIRLVLNVLWKKRYELANDRPKRLIIVGSEEEGSRVLSLLKLTGTNHNFIGFVRPEEITRSHPGKSQELNTYRLGDLSQLTSIVEVFAIDEVIFCARDLASNRIIALMAGMAGKAIEFKIAPPDSLFIIGSNSIDDPGELYVIDINSIGKKENRRNKRFLDITFSIALLLVSPILMWLQQRPWTFFLNLFKVLLGSLSLVGYNLAASGLDELPRIRPGILHPGDQLRDLTTDSSTLQRLNTLYAKDYQTDTDLRILWKGLRKLGRTAGN